MRAVSQNGWALQFATEMLKGERNIVMKAVSQTGWALQFATEELKGDREIVMNAVSQTWQALNFSAEGLRSDREIILIAVSQRGRPRVNGVGVGQFLTRFHGMRRKSGLSSVQIV